MKMSVGCSARLAHRGALQISIFCKPASGDFSRPNAQPPGQGIFAFPHAPALRESVRLGRGKEERNEEYSRNQKIWCYRCFFVGSPVCPPWTGKNGRAAHYGGARP